MGSNQIRLYALHPGQQVVQHNANDVLPNRVGHQDHNALGEDELGVDIVAVEQVSGVDGAGNCQVSHLAGSVHDAQHHGGAADRALLKDHGTHDGPNNGGQAHGQYLAVDDLGDHNGEHGHDEHDLALPSDSVQETAPATAPTLNSEPIVPSMDG